MESPASVRSGVRAISERDMLHVVSMVNRWPTGMRVGEDTFMNMPLASAPHPHMHDEYPTAWISEKNPTTEEEAR
eukprot:1887448-Pyramimonas_sp.AAC.1